MAINNNKLLGGLLGAIASMALESDEAEAGVFKGAAAKLAKEVEKKAIKNSQGEIIGYKSDANARVNFGYFEPEVLEQIEQLMQHDKRFSGLKNEVITTPHAPIRRWETKRQAPEETIDFLEYLMNDKNARVVKNYRDINTTPLAILSKYGDKQLLAPITKLGKKYRIKTLFSPSEEQMQAMTIPTGGRVDPTFLNQIGIFSLPSLASFPSTQQDPFSAVSRNGTGNLLSRNEKNARANLRRDASGEYQGKLMTIPTGGRVSPTFLNQIGIFSLPSLASFPSTQQDPFSAVSRNGTGNLLSRNEKNARANLRRDTSGEYQGKPDLPLESPLIDPIDIFCGGVSLIPKGLLRMLAGISMDTVGTIVLDNLFSLANMNAPINNDFYTEEDAN